MKHWIPGDCTRANEKNLCKGFTDARGENGGWHTRLPGHECDKKYSQGKCPGYQPPIGQTKKAPQ